MAPKRKQTSTPSGHVVIANKKIEKYDIRMELKKFMIKYKFPILAPNGMYTNIEDWVRKKDHNGNYPLFIACQLDGKEQLSLEMIKNFPEAIKQDGWSGNRNPFHLACAYGKVSLISQLLKNYNMMIDEIDMDGRTPLFYACKYQRLDVIRYLCKKTTININAKDSRNQTALHYSCDNCLLHACNELLNCENLLGEDIDIKGNSPLFTLLLSMFQGKYLLNYNNCILVMKKIISKFPLSIYFHSSDGCNILHKITGNHSHDRKISRLCWEYITSIANKLVNEPDIGDGYTPIHYACLFMNDFPSFLMANSRIVTRNYKPSILINQRDNYGQTVFYLTCKQHNFNAFFELIKYQDIDIDITDMNGNTALHALFDDMPSVISQNAPMVMSILNMSPFMVLRKNACNDTAIDIVRRHIEYASELIEYGSDTAKQDLIILNEINDQLQQYLLKARIAMFEYFLCNNEQ